MVSEEALQIGEKRREVKGKGVKERFAQLNAVFQRISSRDKKVFLCEQTKKQRKMIEWKKTGDLFNRIGDVQGTFHAKMGTIKDRNGKYLTEKKILR